MTENILKIENFLNDEDVQELKDEQLDLRGSDNILLDWNLLMLVIEKIDSQNANVDIETDGVSIEVGGEWLETAGYMEDCTFETFHDKDSKFINTYNAIIDYIDWYTKENK